MMERKRWTVHRATMSLSNMPRCSSCCRLSLSQEIIIICSLLSFVIFQASSISVVGLQARSNSCFVNLFDPSHHCKNGCKSTTLKQRSSTILLYGEGGGSTFSSSTAESIPPEVYRRRKLQQQLLQNTKQLDPAFNEETQKGSYSSIGWSNRIGTVLTPVAVPGVYTADRPFLWNTIDVSCRMTLIQMQSTTTSNNDTTIKPDLFVHSPVRLDAQLKEAVDKLGVVKHIVSPNYEHVSFAAKWAEEYPNANMWGCPGLIEREPDIKFTGELPFGLRPPSCPSSSAQTEALPTNIWDMKEIQAMHFDCEINPFTGRPFFNEVVFFHTPSKTLMMTDTYWNYPQVEGVPNSQYQRIKERVEQTSKGNNESSETINDFGPWELAPSMKVPWKSLLWKFGMDQVYRPFYLNLMVGADSERQAKYESIVTFMLNEWDVETLIPAHGDIIRGKELIRQILQQHFGVNA